MSGLCRSEWRELAKEHLSDLKALRAAERWSAIYHIAGVAVECGLKAIIARTFKLHCWPEKNLEQKIYQHTAKRLEEQLPNFAKTDLQNEQRRDPEFWIHWQLMLSWDVDTRYKSYSQAEADGIYVAVTQPRHGVARWLRRHW